MIFDHPQLPKDELLIVNLEGIGRWRDVVAAGAELLTFELEEPALTPDSATPPVVFITATHKYALELEPGIDCPDRARSQRPLSSLAGATRARPGRARLLPLPRA